MELFQDIMKNIAFIEADVKLSNVARKEYEFLVLKLLSDIDECEIKKREDSGAAAAAAAEIDRIHEAAKEDAAAALALQIEQNVAELKKQGLGNEAALAKARMKATSELQEALEKRQRDLTAKFDNDKAILNGQLEELRRKEGEYRARENELRAQLSGTQQFNQETFERLRGEQMKSQRRIQDLEQQLLQNGDNGLLREQLRREKEISAALKDRLAESDAALRSKDTAAADLAAAKLSNTSKENRLSALEQLLETTQDQQTLARYREEIDRLRGEIAANQTKIQGAEASLGVSGEAIEARIKEQMDEFRRLQQEDRESLLARLNKRVEGEIEAYKKAEGAEKDVLRRQLEVARAQLAAVKAETSAEIIQKIASLEAELKVAELKLKQNEEELEAKAAELVTSGRNLQEEKDRTAATLADMRRELDLKLQQNRNAEQMRDELLRLLRERDDKDAVAELMKFKTSQQTSDELDRLSTALKAAESGREEDRLVLEGELADAKEEIEREAAVKTGEKDATIRELTGQLQQIKDKLGTFTFDMTHPMMGGALDVRYDDVEKRVKQVDGSELPVRIPTQKLLLDLVRNPAALTELIDRGLPNKPAQKYEELIQQYVGGPFLGGRRKRSRKLRVSHKLTRRF